MTLNVDPAKMAGQASSPPTGRVIAVMEMLGADPARQFSLAEISRTLDISRATGHAILATLVAHEWVTRDPRSARYAWGPAIASLAKPADLFRGELEELAAATGTQVYLARREANSLVIIDVAGESLTAPRIGRGTKTPFVAPFGRDYVAWSSAEAQQAWLEAIGQPSGALRKRISAVLNETRERGFVVERLTREYLRVYSALQALSGDGEVDAITAQLAKAFADLSVIDVLPGELGEGATHSIATVSAPIANAEGVVTMSVTAAPFATVDSREITRLGERVRLAAIAIGERLNRYGDQA
ncbi:DNA-binding IclR family transcriptional regulator [Mycolicibacterium sp. BK556]|uniref:helix-turn-helix domain-containing protein n=1 Tax=Mycobacteriaceae TaxID=1762 RepID=UPI00106204CE|nr:MULTISPECIES: helix-turn-helix domain-containing protein [Mycobacteriaceae]MBB3603526.1 DNA-binding IclR family transcriptional regulator [Mycolicibacterium sp. BK556]MBB3633721.1 DNA-binding IclR family transcriptional regulator [Mycolicibacterium sp. BK607]MBB3751303.1 DNA-binding IclR family transcriptional regulator [Mycolicibacterium sp. BK634]TDO11834.1 DNA-binding IclR family transcriptional regulator [Mycobacterium sp. BK086]